MCKKECKRCVCVDMNEVVDVQKSVLLQGVYNSDGVCFCFLHIVLHVFPFFEKSAFWGKSFKQKNVQILKFVKENIQNGEVLDIVCSSFRARLLKKCKKLLCVLPNVQKYKELRVSQQMVLTYFTPEVLISSPELIEGPLYIAFLDYKKRYFATYMQECGEYQKQAEVFHKNLPELKEKIEAIYRFSLLPELSGIPQESFAHQLSALEKKYPLLPYSEAEIEALLHTMGKVKGFMIGSPLPEKDVQNFEQNLKKSLQSYYKKLKAVVVKKVVQHESFSEIGKLLHLIQVSNVDDITSLFSNESADYVVMMLRKVLNTSE